VAHLRVVDTSGRSKLRRAVIAIAWCALFWAFVLQLTGGFALEVGPLRVSSRGPERPLLLAVIVCAAMWLLDRRRDWRREWRADAEWLLVSLVTAIPGPIRTRVTSGTLAALAAMTMTVTGLLAGAHVAGGADSYGYVSQAHLWATASLKVPLALEDLPAGVPEEALVPLGYRLSADRRSAVPTYAPGLPMLMALFEMIGGQRAVFLVMPILAGWAVWATYALGRSVIGTWGGSLAAAFLALSPVFIFQLIRAPMSDIVATAWWTTALVLAWRQANVAAFGAGAATALAILTRPNLVLLAVVPAALVLNDVRAAGVRGSAPRLAGFFGPPLIACLLVAVLNTYWYGSPLESGYGVLAGTLFRFDYLGPNIVNYATWFFEGHGLLAVLAVAGVAVAAWDPRFQDRRARLGICIAFAVVALGSYAFYLPVDAWWTLRLALPAFPVLFVLAATAVAAVAERVAREWRFLPAVAVLAAATLHVGAYGRSTGLWDSEGEKRFATVGRYISDHTPSRAVLFAMLHSGSVRYYSGRSTVRFDWVPPDRFETMVAHLKRRGFIPFVLVDEGEAEVFEQRFTGIRKWDAIDSSSEQLRFVSLYRLAD
jgi:hypothetical protein